MRSRFLSLCAQCLAAAAATSGCASASADADDDSWYVVACARYANADVVPDHKARREGSAVGVGQTEEAASEQARGAGDGMSHHVGEPCQSYGPLDRDAAAELGGQLRSR